MSVRNRLDLAIVVAIAAIANFGYLVLSNGDFYYPDSFTYLAPARGLLQGLGFVDHLHQVETIRTPGYPLLLALFGARTLPVIILQHLLNVFLAAGIYLFVLHRIKIRSPALLASILFSIDAPTLHYANKLLTETPFTVVLYVLFVLALQRPRPILLGLLTGILVLIRPIALLYFVAVALFLVLQRIPMRKVIVFVAVALILPAGWAGRNRLRTGVFTISSIAGYNMLGCRAGGALAIEDEGDFRKAIAEEAKALSDEADDEIQARLHIEDARELPDSLRAKYYTEIAWRIIREHPLSFLQLTVRGLMVNLFDSDWDAMWNISQVSPAVLETFYGALTIVLFVLAAIGLILLWKIDRPMTLMIILTVGYFIGISAGGEAESRFRVPVVPQLMIAAAMGVEAVRRGVAAVTPSCAE